MADYSKTTNFTAKDSLASGDPNKVVKGSEIDTEFDNIATASATKADKVTSATDHNLLMMDASGNLEDSTISTNGTGTITATFVGDITGNVTGNVTGNADTVTTNANLTGEVTSVGNAATVADGVIDNANLIDATTGTTYEVAASDASSGISGGTWTKYKEIYCPYGGEFNVYFELDPAGNSASARIYVNGVATGTTRTSSAAGYQNWDEDITISAGDTIELWASSTNVNQDVRQFRIRQGSSPVDFVNILD